MQGSNAGFSIPIAKHKKIGPEANPWWWHPGNVYARQAPEWFREQLSKVGEELAVTWNPTLERWAVFTKAPRIQHPVCQGWKLLFIHQTGSKEYLPLDERLFARLYAASVLEHGSAKVYLDRVVSELERDKERQIKQAQQDQIDMAMPFFEHSQIKNIGKGNKFSTYHA